MVLYKQMGWEGGKSEREGTGLIFGDYSHRSDEGCSSQTTPDGVLAVGGDAKQLEVVNHTGEDQLCAHNNGRASTGAELRNGQDDDDDEHRTDHTSGPCPPRGFGQHQCQVCWWAALDLDQPVYHGCEGA